MCLSKLPSSDISVTGDKISTVLFDSMHLTDIAHCPGGKNGTLQVCAETAS
jgi:hypothetical protein